MIFDMREEKGGQIGVPYWLGIQVPYWLGIQAGYFP